MKIYLASSWRNEEQPGMVAWLREHCGHEVYDFRNPPGGAGFHWGSIPTSGVRGGPEAWKLWSTRDYLGALDHDIAVAGFRADFQAMQWADVIIWLWPAGRSSALEVGWAAGRGKPTALYIPPRAEFEPELMVKMLSYVTNDLDALHSWLTTIDPEFAEVAD